MKRFFMCFVFLTVSLFLYAAEELNSFMGIRFGTPKAECLRIMEEKGMETYNPEDDEVMFLNKGASEKYVGLDTETFTLRFKKNKKKQDVLIAGIISVHVGKDFLDSFSTFMVEAQNKYDIKRYAVKEAPQKELWLCTKEDNSIRTFIQGGTWFIAFVAEKPKSDASQAEKENLTSFLGVDFGTSRFDCVEAMKKDGWNIDLQSADTIFLGRKNTTYMGLPADNAEMCFAPCRKQNVLAYGRLSIFFDIEHDIDAFADMFFSFIIELHKKFSVTRYDIFDAYANGGDGKGLMVYTKNGSRIITGISSGILKTFELIVLFDSGDSLLFARQLPPENKREYREMSVVRYNAEKKEYYGGERVCFKNVMLDTSFEYNSVWVRDDKSSFYASMTDDAFNWLLDFAEKTERWKYKHLNIYGVVLGEKEGLTRNDRFRIEKIEEYR